MITLDLSSLRIGACFCNYLVFFLPFVALLAPFGLGFPLLFFFFPLFFFVLPSLFICFQLKLFFSLKIWF